MVEYITYSEAIDRLIESKGCFTFKEFVSTSGKDATDSFLHIKSLVKIGELMELGVTYYSDGIKKNINIYTTPDELVNINIYTTPDELVNERVIKVLKDYGLNEYEVQKKIRKISDVVPSYGYNKRSNRKIGTMKDIELKGEIMTVLRKGSMTKEDIAHATGIGMEKCKRLLNSMSKQKCVEYNTKTREYIPTRVKY